MNKKYIKISLLLVLFISFKAIAQTTDSTRPNIIVILADDLGYADVGFNRDANFPVDRGVIPTPNIDALANSGIILKNAHVAHPFCGPSRVAILTGMMPHRIGAQYNLPNDITSTLGIPENETYFTEVLQDSNYNTSAIGKWHLGFQEGKYQPLDRGFDHFFGFLGGGKGYFEEGYEDNFYNRLGGSNPVTNEYQDPLQRNRSYIDRNEYSNAPNQDYLTDVLTDNAIDYIAANKGKSDPFFMYLAYNAPHTPLEATDAEVAQFKIDNPNFENLIRNSDYITKSTPVEKLTTQAEKDDLIDKFVEARIIYATMTVNMDKNIGRVLDELKKNINDFNNTVIIFLSDNGGYTYSKGAVNWPLDALKGSVKEGGHKVPMFVSWPNKITTASTYNHQISSLDIYPTVLDLAGANVPENKIIDGVSFMDKIIAGQNARPEDGLIIMRPQNGFHNGGIAYDNWKITKTGNNGSWNLYNVLTDPGETTNIRNTEPNGDQIVQDILDNAIATVADFKDVKPAWYDNDRFDIDGDGIGDGHVHSFLWNDGTLPAYDRLFETNILKLSGELNKISIKNTTDAIEGITDGVFTISLPEGVMATEDITLIYTVSGEAISGSDYTALTGTATINNGENSTQIIVSASQDGLDEVSESVILTLNSTSFGSIESAEATISIFDVVDATSLTAGDIAIVGWEAGNNSKLSFMLLKDISAITKISISNRTWSNTSNEFTGDYSVDDIWTWTTGDAFKVGDIFTLHADGLVKQVINNQEITVGKTSHDYTGKVAESSDGDFDFSTNGEGILFFQADPFALPTDANSSSWIAGLNTALGWGNGGGNSRSELPTALTNTVNATIVGEKHNYGVYQGELLGTPAQLRANINNSTNWVFSEDTGYNLWYFSQTINTVAGDIGIAGTLSTANFTTSKISIYPNPVSQNFTVQLNNKYNNVQIDILSVTGKLIQRINSKNCKSHNINGSGLSTGMYILRVMADDNLSIEKLIKL